ncbi:hypothetical protein N0V93_005654 [Gnomoniopsis smithogilvyi]|uniref:FAD/NAD(P)-binding domain-containing protein n=1 Tax=Gnomoniopsis smithogilvyi TaxID=1191159 RepID=A0A9W8YV45_9PEZI|nr:hypothetical protein N0V93_005654 [Gnomoniopsis smithogilvyi]
MVSAKQPALYGAIRNAANAQKSRQEYTAVPTTATLDEPIYHDVLIIGAGMAGINMAYRLQTQMPHLSFRVLEARNDIGGTWDFLKYPGLRSDSDMYTYGFVWRPWRHRLLGDGAEILSYLHECVSAFGLDERISFRHKVIKADWSSEMKQWAIQADQNGHTKTYVAKWLVLSPGQVIHPQFWPTEYDSTDKRVIIIGSGATAVTLFPALVQSSQAKQVTVLQRSPSYISSVPNPELPAKTPFDPHFVPAYMPWDQRLCFAKDGDFFRALHSDNADVVTGTIRTITVNEIELEDGRTLKADVIITATGLKMHFAGAIPISVDGDAVTWPEKLLWNGGMVQDVPNLFFMWG